MYLYISVFDGSPNPCKNQYVAVVVVSQRYSSK